MVKKVYLIKGSVIQNGEINEWIEKVTLCKDRAKKMKEKLNNNLLKDIEKGREIFDLYLKDTNKSWNEMEFDIERMGEKEFILFCDYRLGKNLPFKIVEKILD